jgi:hypothetical protein
MLNNLLEYCLNQFEPLTQNHFEHVEPLESYNLIRTLFIEICPSLLPATDQIDATTPKVSKNPKDKYICKGLESCWHAHSIGQFRRPLFKTDGELAYFPIPCGRNHTIPAAGIKNCHNGNLCTFAHSLHEMNFHPLTYRTVACQKTKSKCTTKYCPLFHKKSEKRDLKHFFKPLSSKASSGSARTHSDKHSSSQGMSSSEQSMRVK